MTVADMQFDNNDEKLKSVTLCRCTGCLTFTCAKNVSSGCFPHQISIKHDNLRDGKQSYYVIAIVLLLLFISGTGVVLMWFTDFYNNVLLSKLVLARNSDTARSWMEPHPKYDTLLKVHIFNYSNIDRYLAGIDSKMRIDDIGPLTYKEHTNKAQVSFNDNFTVTFRDYKSFKFLPELSTCGEHETLVVPNVPLLTAVAKIDEMRDRTFVDKFKKSVFSSFIRSYNEVVFKNLTAFKYLWGYRDKIAASTGPGVFGLLKARNGISTDSVQFNTGEDDIKKFSIITQFNGQPTLDFWEGDYCNQIDGSDATRFPPHLLKTREDLHVFLQVLCRKIPLKFDKEVTLYEDISALRYRTPIDIFSHPRVNPKNACFCKNTRTCLPSGVINATLCYAGAPIYPSLPHFFTGDPSLFDHIEGLNPQAAIHQTYADIHPRFAFPIGGASRIQINILLHKNNILNDKVRRFKDKTILPLIWIEITAGELTPDMLDDLYLSTVGLNATEKALKYFTLFAFVLCAVIFLMKMHYLWRLYRERLDQRTLRDAHNKERTTDFPEIHNVF